MAEKTFSILKGGTTDGAVLRGRDVEFELQGVELDPRVKSILYRLAEINHVNMKGIAELAMMMDKMVDTMMGITTVAENMKDATERLRNRSDADVPSDITTESNH